MANKPQTTLFLAVFLLFSHHAYAFDYWNDVTNPIFAGGAVGNDIHDDTAAINAATKISMVAE